MSLTLHTSMCVVAVETILSLSWITVPTDTSQKNAAQSESANSQAATSQPAASQPAASQPAKKSDRADLEKQLESALDNVSLDGIYQMVVGDGPLSEPKPDKYLIESAHKVDGDWWVFKARILYDHHDVTLPVRVRIVWAEDTPVVTVDDVAIPGIGTYSARVMFYRGYYSGTWFGKGYGGIMSGRILKAPEKPESEK